LEDSVSTMRIRDAALADLPELLAIYNEVLANSTAIWSDQPRTEEAQHAWLTERMQRGLPVLVCAVGERIAGYCSYGPFRAWSGYDATVESSIYFAPEQRGRGLGAGLLQALLDRAKQQGLHVVIAGIDADNAASIRLHAKLGFEPCGHLHQVGRKFGRYLDLLLYERRLE
jgi:L-amino acid N-acyltransferase